MFERRLVTVLCMVTVSLTALMQSFCAERLSDNIINSEANRVSSAVEMSDLPLTIAKQMAPLVTFSPNEESQCCYPADAILHWERKVVMRTEAETFDVLSHKWLPGKHCELAGASTLPAPFKIPSKDGSFISTCSKANSVYTTAFQAVPCWCEFFWEKPYLQVKYWMFYPFNDHPNDTPLNLFDHEADWEHIELRATVRDDGSFKYFYLFDKHGKSQVILPQSWETVNGEIKTHPKVWAAEGSHVPYETTGKFEMDLEGVPGLASLVDNVEDSNVRWKTYENLKFNDENSLTNAVWSFKQPWGSIELTPEIPIFGGRATDCPTGPGARERFANSNGVRVFP